MLTGGTHNRGTAGFTLIELVIVVVIAGILVTVALQGTRQISDTARVEETRQEMDALAMAIAGNPGLHNNGVRTDFGYVGDVGALPPNLDALYANPGGYATWNGPYIRNRFTQIADDYKTDAWGTLYAFGGIAITSTGSGENLTRRVAPSSDHLLYNSVAGNVYDLDGTPPGDDFDDSLTIRVRHPDGAGNYTTRTVSPDAGGYFELDSLPIGNHDLTIVYEPSADTVTRFVSVLPDSRLYGEYFLPDDFWPVGSGGGGGVVPVVGSDSLYSDCHGISVWIENTSGSTITVDWVTLSWLSPTAYYRYVIWDGATVVNENNPKFGSGQTAMFSTSQDFAAGAVIRLDFDFFKSQPTGGPDVEMDNTTFTVTLSDGSTFDFTTGDCP